MNFKKPTAPVLASYAALSIGLSAVNYYLAFVLTYVLLKENFNLNFFIICLVLLTLAQSIYLSKVTGSKLIAVIATTTIFSWILNSFFSGYYGLFSSTGNIGYYLINAQALLEHLELNLLFLVFSILGALIGEKLRKKTPLKKSKK